MKLSVDLRPNHWDLLVAAVILVLAAACAGGLWMQNQESGNLAAVISIDGTEVDRIDLPQMNPVDKTYTGHGYTLCILVQGNEVRVLESDCPGRDCVHTGSINEPGQSIVCLPARLSIQLVRQSGPSGGDVDLVIG